MVVKCYLTSSSSLQNKGVEAVVDCPVDSYVFKSLSDLTWLIREFVKKTSLNGTLVFESNEPIGTTHMLYKYRVLLEDKYVSIRVVVAHNYVTRILFTIPSRELLPKTSFSKYEPSRDIVKSTTRYRSSRAPPGQYFIQNLVVYATLGYPKNIDISKWRLEIGGEVENEATLSLSDLYTIGLRTIKTSFHCVTGWSVEEVEFTGPLIKSIVDRVKPRDTVKWVYVECLDGYSTVIPFEEVLSDEAIIAIEMNSKPLEVEHGYPARLVIPQLYGWKSAKWVSRVVFTSEYRDGYWEALGYHPRGRVDLEERFKKT